MGNLITTLKKFFSDKNTVTIFAVFLGIIVLYVGYNWRVNKTVTFIEVLYAKEEINSNTQITPEMLGTIKVNAELLKNSPNIVQSVGQITDENQELFFVNFGYSIPAGSLLYKEQLISKKEKVDEKLYNIPDNYRYYTIEVDMSSTFGNAIAPGNSIDIYAYIDDNNTRMYGKLYHNINVIDVVDGNWATIAGDKEKSPDLLVVLVKEEDFRLLKKAENINGIKFDIAPNNSSYEDMKKDKGDTAISSLEIQLYIEGQFLDTSEDY